MNLQELQNTAAEANTTTLHYFSIIDNYLQVRKNNHLPDNEMTMKYKTFDINNLLYDIGCYEDISQVNKDIQIELKKFKEGYTIDLDLVNDALKIEHYLYSYLKEEIMLEKSF